MVNTHPGVKELATKLDKGLQIPMEELPHTKNLHYHTSQIC